MLLLLLDIILVICFVILIEYWTAYDKIIYKFNRLTDHQLDALGFKKLGSTQDLLSKEDRYAYKNVIFLVTRRRFSFTNHYISISVMRKQKHLCKISALPKSFKTQLYRAYMQIKHPFLGRAFKHVSHNQSVKSPALKSVLEKEGLITYERV